MENINVQHLYESIEKQIEAYNCARTGGAHPRWNDEIVALIEFRDRIGQALDGK